jgi:inorganic pyrophosphatase
MATRSILVFMDAPVIPGCVIRARLIGAIQAKQRNESKGEWIYTAANSSRSATRVARALRSF